MKKILQKNYIILALLLIVTVFLTLLLANIYTSKNKLTSDFYEYANKITIEDFKEYILENPDTIIYISDKYDLTNESLEKKLQTKIDNLNIKENLIFLDKEELNIDFIEYLNKNYKLSLDLEKTPIIIVIINNKVVKVVYIENDLNVDNLIDYGVFK